MGVFNYSAYAHAIQIGVRNQGMHPIAVLLLTSIIQYPSVKNRWGNPYKISNTEARDWFHGSQDIPQGIRDGSDNSKVVAGAVQYFEDNVVPEIYSDKEQDVLDKIIEDARGDKQVQASKLKKFEKLYQEGDTAQFLAETFLYAVKGKNGLYRRPVKKKKSKPLAETSDIEEFENLLKTRYPKPEPMTPPAELADHELIYASELFAAYADAEKVPEIVREDLSNTKYARYSRNFTRQRKYYYMAETVLEASRDTLKLKESEGFDKAKDEVFDGVIETCDKTYDNGYDRLVAVIEKASGVILSKGVQAALLEWIGPGEKQGMCHMLVNDRRMRWVEDD